MKKLKDYVYTSPCGMKFIFDEDLQELLGKKKYKEFNKYFVGQTAMLILNHHLGYYDYDVQRFLRGQPTLD